MDIDEKEQLAHKDEMGIKACAIRLLAARNAAGFPKAIDFAKACNFSKTSLSNMEKALQYPNSKVMSYLYRGHRIDFNFMMAGQFSQLPEDVQEKLFPELVTSNNAWDRKQGSS